MKEIKEFEAQRCRCSLPHREGQGGSTPFDLSLYLVTDRPLSGGRDMAWIVREAAMGGVTMVQLREKDCPTNEFITLARELKAALQPLGIPLIINDRVDVALAVDADGLHIGQSDMPYDMARRLLGPDRIIGLSVETMDEVIAANALDVDYIGISPVYATPTKTDTLQPFGLDGVSEVLRLSRHRCVAIGGMNRNTIGEVIRRGVEGVAVVSAIVAADSPREASAELAGVIRNNRPSWSSVAFASVSDTMHRIEQYEFIQQMLAGTLPQEQFVRYLQQDKIYLKEYSRDLYALADMMPDKAEGDFFRATAREGMESENAMQAMLGERFGIHAEALPVATTLRYTDFLRHYTDMADVPIALAAVLPCYWVYNEVGKYLVAQHVDDANPYKEWIATYGSEEMSRATDYVVSLIDRFASGCSQEKQARMHRIFAEGCALELDFFAIGIESESEKMADESCCHPDGYPQPSTLNPQPKRVLTIAGSDSGGGAGIQADIKSISANGCFATSAITAITAQNTLGVNAVEGLPISIIEGQIEAVLGDIGTDSIKIGMLHSAEVVQCVARMLRKYKIKDVVLDPVMVSTSGHKLIEDDAIEQMRTELMPLARVITPNIPEAEILLGESIGRQGDLPAAARRLAEMYGVSVLLKAGHLVNDELIDIFYNRETGETVELSARRIDTPNTHGTGCTLSSAFASQLAKGLPLTEAARAAKAYINAAIIHGAAYTIGHGHGPVCHFY